MRTYVKSMRMRLPTADYAPGLREPSVARAGQRSPQSQSQASGHCAPRSQTALPRWEYYKAVSGVSGHRLDKNSLASLTEDMRSSAGAARRRKGGAVCCSPPRIHHRISRPVKHRANFIDVRAKQPGNGKQLAWSTTRRTRRTGLHPLRRAVAASLENQARCPHAPPSSSGGRAA